MTSRGKGRKNSTALSATHCPAMSAEQKRQKMLEVVTASRFLHQRVTRGGAILGTVLVRKRAVKIILDEAINTTWAAGEARAAWFKGRALRNDETCLEKPTRRRDPGSGAWRMHRIPLSHKAKTPYENSNFKKKQKD